MSTFIKGEDLILYVHDGTIYRPLACLTSNSLSQTQSIIESQTKCDPGVTIKDAGTMSYDISAEGQYIDTTTSVTGALTKASHDYLFTILGTSVTWKLDSGLAGTVAYFGTAIIGDLSLDAGAGDELATFSCTLAGSGEIVTTDPV